MHLYLVSYTLNELFSAVVSMSEKIEAIFATSGGHTC